MNLRNLISVNSIFSSTKTSVVSVWDASMCSLCNETVKKRTEILTFICNQHMDILFIAETWLKLHGNEGRYDLTPAGYIAKSFPRESRGGGITVIYNKCLSKWISITATLSFHHLSFEVIPPSIAMFWKYKLFMFI